jgi:hypothetical protein
MVLIPQDAGLAVRGVSTPLLCTGGRSTVYALLYSSTLLMTTCGPVLGALMFMRRGNDWSIRTLESVMLVGMVSIHSLFPPWSVSYGQCWPSIPFVAHWTV